MLIKSKENIDIITFFIISILSVILVIIVDIYIFKTYENNYWLKGTYDKDGPNYNIYIKRKSISSKIVDIDNILPDLMQINDVYNNMNEESKQKILENQNLENNWRIKIPKINVDAPIISGTTQDILAISVGHFKESQYWNGNVALAAHNRGDECNFFENIKDLQIGDKIIYSTEKGEREYRVVINKIIHQSDWSYIENTSDNRITLITCVENMYEYRRCIQAIEIK